MECEYDKDIQWNKTPWKNNVLKNTTELTASDEHWDRTVHSTELSMHSTKRMWFINISMTPQD